MFYKKLKPNTEKFELLYITEDITKKLLYCLDVSKAPGIDEIPSRFLKDGAEILAKPISDIINLSIKLSTFPDKYKIAKLIPLFKKGSMTDPKNYRPISLPAAVRTGLLWLDNTSTCLHVRFNSNSSHHQLQYALGSFGLITQAHASMYVSTLIQVIISCSTHWAPLA